MRHDAACVCPKNVPLQWWRCFLDILKYFVGHAYIRMYVYKMNMLYNLALSLSCAEIDDVTGIGLWSYFHLLGSKVH